MIIQNKEEEKRKEGRKEMKEGNERRKRKYPIFTHQVAFIKALYSS